MGIRAQPYPIEDPFIRGGSVHLLLFLPFIQLCVYLFHKRPLPLNRQQIEHLSHHPVRLFHAIWQWEWHVLIVWSIVAAIAMPLLAIYLRRALVLLMRRHRTLLRSRPAALAAAWRVFGRGTRSSAILVIIRARESHRCMEQGYIASPDTHSAKVACQSLKLNTWERPYKCAVDEVGLVDVLDFVPTAKSTR